MAVHFHSLVVTDVKKETPDCVSVKFDIPEELSDQFLYKEGQNITIKLTVDGEELRRSYSLCTAPFENQIKVAIKKVSGGLFSRFANEDLKKGDMLEVLPPVGKFNARLGTGASQYLAIAAGSGITPVISIIKHSLQTQPDCHFTLVYGNQSRNTIIFFEELEAIKNKYIERFNFINILSRERTESEINHGRIDNQKLGQLQKIVPFTSFDSIYLCGPEKMIFATQSFLEDLGIDPHKIHFELFNTPGQAGNKLNAPVKAESLSSGPKSHVTVKLDGRSVDFELSQQGEAILDAALKQGADLPFACKGGVCCTCRAKLVSGEVEMDVNYALEPEEVAQGFILTCQSHPRSERVVVDFDVK